MTAPTPSPMPHELWRQANGDRDRYLELMREHGHIIPGSKTVRADVCPVCGGTVLAPESVHAHIRDVHPEAVLPNGETVDEAIARLGATPSPMPSEERLREAWAAYTIRFADQADPVRTSETSIRDAFAAGWAAALPPDTREAVGEPGEAYESLADEREHMASLGDPDLIAERAVSEPVDDETVRKRDLTTAIPSARAWWRGYDKPLAWHEWANVEANIIREASARPVSEPVDGLRVQTVAKVLRDHAPDIGSTDRMTISEAIVRALAASTPRPGLDEERLARAICATREPPPVEGIEMFVDDECRAGAAELAAEYARQAGTEGSGE